MLFDKDGLIEKLFIEPNQETNLPIMLGGCTLQKIHEIFFNVHQSAKVCSRLIKQALAFHFTKKGMSRQYTYGANLRQQHMFSYVLSYSPYFRLSCFHRIVSFGNIFGRIHHRILAIGCVLLSRFRH
jgi:hypothetical protein